MAATEVTKQPMSKKASLHPARGERVYVDMTSSLSSLTFHVLEAIACTGLAWIAIGYIDGGGLYNWGVTDYAGPRNAVLIIWVLLLLWRLVLPVWRARRKRFMVTNRRLVVRQDRLSASAAELPLSDITDVNRGKRGQILVHAWGRPRPLVFSGIPRTKRVVEESQRCLAAVPPRSYYMG